MEARDLTRNALRMYLPLKEVIKYQMFKDYWHTVELKDGRRFSIMFDQTEPLKQFQDEMRSVLHSMGDACVVKVKTEDAILQSHYIGPPISGKELRHKLMRELSPTREEDEMDLTDGFPSSERLRRRPLPPIPQISKEAEASSDEDLVYDDINEVLIDEETLLQDAILLGHEEKAAHWAKVLAKQKRIVFITSGINLADMGQYLDTRDLKPQQCTDKDDTFETVSGYIDMQRRRPQGKINTRSNDSLPPPVPPRLVRPHSRSPSPVPRKRLTTPEESPDKPVYLLPSVAPSEKHPYLTLSSRKSPVANRYKPTVHWV